MVLSSPPEKTRYTEAIRVVLIANMISTQQKDTKDVSTVKFLVDAKTLVKAQSVTARQVNPEIMKERG